MWIIPKTNEKGFYRYAQDTGGLNWDCDESLAKELERSLTWRSKRSRWRTWLQRWKRVSWMQLLSGRILRPLMERDFAAKYTASLPVIPASRSRSLEKDRGQMTLDTFGRILAESCRQLDLFGVSSRTSPDTLLSDSPKFTESYEIWVTLLRQDCLQRQSAVSQWRKEHGFSYWRRPIASRMTYCYRGEDHKRPNLTLDGQVKYWARPTSIDYKGTDQPNREGGMSLPQQVLQSLRKESIKNRGRKSVLLNPDWVEQLMGLQAGWTGCGC